MESSQLLPRTGTKNIVFKAKPIVVNSRKFTSLRSRFSYFISLVQIHKHKKFLLLLNLTRNNGQKPNPLTLWKFSELQTHRKTEASYSISQTCTLKEKTNLNRPKNICKYPSMRNINLGNYTFF